METIKVNMNPNPLDVQTIHASQNDGEARQWEFELHNNGELIDTSEITEQLFFKSYKGGTEQLLPENTSTPTTSPFKGDIRYPQGLLTDQEFTYRQSPTEEDGNAKIETIYGNTLVWNQLVQNGNFATTSGWTTSGRGTLTVSDNIATITPLRSGLIVAGPVISIKQGHKYLLSVEVKADSTSVWVGTQYNDVHARLYSNGTNQWQRMTTIVSNFANDSQSSPVFGDYRTSGWTASQIRNFMFIDLTQMGLDTLTDAEILKWFADYFPLSYYSYNQGSLLSFNGNGIKTVGFNQWDEEWELGSISNVGVNIASTTEIRSKNYIRVQSNKEYYLHASVASTFNYRFYDADKRFISGGYIGRNNTLLIPTGVAYMRFYMGSAYGTIYNNDICINISDTERNGQYEPYTSSTLSLPISTYFPTGMKSAGSVYDELTESKAISRIGAVDLGSLNWSYVTTGTALAPYFMALFSGIKSQGNPAVNKANILFSKYQTVARNDTNFVDKTICADGNRTALTQIQIKDLSFTDATAFKNSLQGQYLYYELATPTETSFTTASLVTENAEIPLSNEDGVLIGKCTEELSAEPGFHDAKIKLSDSDGTCYSNKLQLHVERSPQ